MDLVALTNPVSEATLWDLQCTFPTDQDTNVSLATVELLECLDIDPASRVGKL